MKAPDLNFEVKANSNTQAACLAIGWMYAEVCSQLDKGIDPRTQHAPAYLEGGILALSQGK